MLLDYIHLWRENVSLHVSYMFVLQFEDARDAEDAIRGRDGYNFDGSRLRVRIQLLRLFVFFEFFFLLSYKYLSIL